jgi:hypothetical protein
MKGRDAVPKGGTHVFQHINTGERIDTDEDKK